jgi:hypothetical protein
LLKAPELQRLSVIVEVLRVEVMIVGVIGVEVMTVRVLSVGVMTLSLRSSAIVFKAFQRGPTKYFFTNENIISCRSNKNTFSD